MKRLIASMTVSIPRDVKKEVNKILYDFCRSYKTPKEVGELWNKLYTEFDIDFLITGMPDVSASGTESWTVNYNYKGEQVDNSLLVYSVYKPSTESNRYEYNIYLS